MYTCIYIYVYVGDFLKWGLKIIHFKYFKRIFHYKPFILGYPHLRKPSSPSGWKGSQHPSGNELCNAKRKVSCHCH